MTDEEKETFKQEIRDYYLIERGIIVDEERLEKFIDAAINDHELDIS